MADLDMRDRLRELGRSAQPTPSAQLQARLIERMRSEGPVVIGRSRERRVRLRVALLAGPLALGAVWMAVRFGAAPSSVARAPRAVQPVHMPAAPVAQRAECASHPAPAPGSRALPGGRSWIDLAERGKIVLEHDCEARLEASDPCRLQLQLTTGRVVVHAQNLFGGELRVRAGSADVVVHGTRFAVQRRGEELDVAVDEGVVGVEHNGAELAPRVHAGQQLQLRVAQTPIVAALSTEARAQLRDALVMGPLESPPAAPVAGSVSPAANAAKLAARADALWRGGDREAARTRYREAGASSGPTAEAAWLALARRELSIENFTAAAHALENYAARFPRGELAAEAAGIAFRAALARHDTAEAERLARMLNERFANTPQAVTATRWRNEQRVVP